MGLSKNYYCCESAKYYLEEFYLGCGDWTFKKLYWPDIHVSRPIFKFCPFCGKLLRKEQK